MAWRDTIKGRSTAGVPFMGAFRGARFIVPGSDATVGRRTEVHEYPLRDKPFVEDMGRAGRRFTIEVFVDGRLVQSGDYTEARDRLIAELEQPGSGTLVHPWYGTLQVALAEPASVRESTREGGRATFRLVFVEAGDELFPSAGSDTVWAVDAAAEAVSLGALDDFLRKFRVDGLSDGLLTEMEDDLYDSLAAIEDVITDASRAIAAEMRAPANMGAAIVGSVRRIATVAGEPGRAFGLYERLLNAGESGRRVPVNTPNRRQQAISLDAVRRLVQRAGLAEAARSAGQMEFGARNDALAAQAKLLDAIDAQAEAVDPLGRPVDDAVYEALMTLRAAVATDLRTRGARLPELTAHTPTQTLPALVLAHQLYGDATRADEIVSRNKLRHPGFIPGGQALEVLSV